MVQERSAGAIIFRREGKEIKYLLLHYEGLTGKQYWGFVKGNIEKEEKEEVTVKREIKEEIGITDVVFVPGFKEEVHWFYKKEGKTIYKEVVYFLVETEKEKVKISHEHIGYMWVGYEKGLEKIKFRNAQEVLGKAREFLLTGKKQKGLGEY